MLSAALLCSLLFPLLYIFFSFFSFPLFGCWIGIYPCLWGWLFGHRCVVVALGLPSARAALPHAGTHWEVPLASTPNCSDASWQLRSHPGGALSRSMSRSCAFISGSVVKNKAFQHIKYPFGNWEWKAPSPSCVSGCSGRALGEPLPHSSVSVRQSLVGALEQILGAVGKG